MRIRQRCAKAILAAAAFCLSLGYAAPALSQAAEVVFDARGTSFTRDGKKQIFEGDVIAIGAGALITADKILVDREKDVIEAEGHIIIVSRNQIFQGESLVFQLRSGDFKITEAMMVANDAAEAAAVTEKVMGFSPSELSFESSRSARLREISEGKLRLQEESRQMAREGKEVDARLIDRYAVLLEQEMLTSTQENPALARLPNDKRQTYKRRREYWEKNKATPLPANAELARAYFRMDGENIVRTNGNDYVAEDSLFTPCKCDEDESPAWAFRAEKTVAQIGGYADMYHPILEIKGIPILYLPYLKIPIKSRRQSGLLMPTFSYNTRSGSIYSQPVFFDFARDADATLTTDIFEKRGTRVGAEFRFQQRKHSGWVLNLETIRDSLWLDERANRQTYRELYSTGLNEARATVDNAAATGTPVPGDADLSGYTDRDRTIRRLGQPGYWNSLDRSDCIDPDPAKREACERELDSFLNVPGNTWRGAAQWRGVTRIAPRLSLVSHGDILSDHRYNEELYLPDDFQEALFGGRQLPAFNRVKAKLHLDGEEFYLGIGSAFGDNVLTDDRFEGEQLPLTAVVQSRLFLLTPARSRGIPVYAQVMTEALRILEQKDENNQDPTSDLELLGDGNWQRSKVKIFAPIITRGVAKVDHFSEAELRSITTTNIKPTQNTIQSWRTGFRIALPIDGKAEMPSFFQNNESDGVKNTDRPGYKKYLQHLMNWSMTLSARPVVVRRGNYGSDKDLLTGGATYFLSDSPRPIANDGEEDVDTYDRMVPHQIISFGTTHRWKVFERGWQRQAPDSPASPPGLAGSTETVQTESEKESTIERARRELLYSVDRPVGDVQQIVDATGGKYHINRYRLVDTNYIEPLTFGAGISYDFVKADKRAKEDKKTKETRPWSDFSSRITASAVGWSLSNETSYSVYDKLATKSQFTLGLPAFFKTNVSIGYTLEKSLSESEYGKREELVTRTQSVNAASTLIPLITTFANLKQRHRDNADPAVHYETALGAAYGSPSGCWGLQFARTKELEKAEADATYLLSLQIIFMGQQRSLPNMSRPVMREYEGT